MLKFLVKRNILLALLFVMAVLGLGEIIVSAYSLLPELSGRKDFTMEYLMGKSLLHGVDPYLPLSELQVLHPIPNDPKMHPPTHPPVMALIGLPLALVPYIWAAGIWFAIEIILVFVTCHLLVRLWAPQKTVLLSVMFTLALFTWDPFSSELIQGQLNSLLLLLLTCSWLQFRRGNDATGGIFLGLAIAIKLLSWPLALFLLLRQNWRGFGATCTSAVSVNLIAVAVIGPQSVWRYFNTTSSMLVSGWSADTANFSVWSLGSRFFSGACNRGFVIDLISPLHESAVLANISSKAIPILFFLGSIYVVNKIKDFSIAFSVMICTSILFSPIAWNHYLVMTSIPIVIAVRAIIRREVVYAKKRLINVSALVAGIFLAVPMSTTRELMYFFETGRSVGDNGVVTHQAPFGAGLFTLIPLAAVLSLMWLLWLLDRNSIVTKDI